MSLLVYRKVRRSIPRWVSWCHSICITRSEGQFQGEFPDVTPSVSQGQKVNSKVSLLMSLLLYHKGRRSIPRWVSWCHSVCIARSEGQFQGESPDVTTSVSKGQKVNSKVSPLMSFLLYHKVRRSIPRWVPWCHSFCITRSIPRCHLVSLLMSEGQFQGELIDPWRYYQRSEIIFLISLANVFVTSNITGLHIDLLWPNEAIWTVEHDQPWLR